ncbi:phospholipase D/nuclease [Myriangium duriaei CBS 260.36]|uniref:Phospholipase n=1 Tax=Myriangium duriaei CBS 260.36 TaxID=1168546 RepID=A0A9P4J915_9PEZI|nr:phospholipase D/nuclease [Myriangium duriaei CBS 260.36]
MSDQDRGVLSDWLGHSVDGAGPHSGVQSGSFFDKISSKVHDVEATIKEKFSGDNSQADSHTHTHQVGQCSDGSHPASAHRFQSFAPQRTGNEAKWYVDGCGYFWAVSVALEQARQTVWILDWWLSPELYLRRPPAQNEQYRLDRTLQRAAARGVKVNIIVYKEVTQALTLSSSHTKHALENLHPNITVFRHPDHLPDRQVLESGILNAFRNLNLNAATASKLPGDALKGIYGMNDETVLYWAHHEKLCLIDGHIAFMGGLDLCFGRWDTNDHPIADVHPGDLNKIVFPGQDYNNARIMDFQDVAHWENNKLDRKWNSRMGWSDMSISIIGPVVEDLKAHFAERWNFIYNEKYHAKSDGRVGPIHFQTSQVGIISHGQDTGPGAYHHEHHRFRERFKEEYDQGRRMLADRTEQFQEQYGSGGQFPHGMPGPISCQIMRSCCKWSNGSALEHSIADAYIDAIAKSKHFVYIENQFFITASTDKQKPIKNKIGAAIVERIIRAAQNNEAYKIIVVMPAIPAFAGDLKSDDALSTRAIMEFQYNSINRGGHSIYESLDAAGINPTQYIRFYNLRNYDRINISDALDTAEQRSGVDYDAARRGYDQRYGAGYAGNPQASGDNYGRPGDDIQNYERFQAATSTLGDQGGLATGEYDSISGCYMTPRVPLRSIPWRGSPEAEIDAFVSEELYVHTKLLIADDRLVICGSANLNDRSQLGSHDSEIAICIEDPTPVNSVMAGQQWTASRFAASLRRFVTRKHLGLVGKQDYTNPNREKGFEPVASGEGNEYDFGSEEDRIVADPLGEGFEDLWNGTARTNTDAFERVFHPVPTDKVRTWKEYDEYYSRFFKTLSGEEEKKAEEKARKEGRTVEAGRPSTWKWGHMVAEEFPGGVEEVKDVLAGIKGTLVEMPLMFLKDEDIAKEGLSLNAFTEEVYT